VLLPPSVDADGVTGPKDPSVVRYGGKWHVFVTTVNSVGYGLGYLRFSRWSEAGKAQVHPLSSSPMGAGYRATPQVFYFAPQKLWYLVYQTGPASYSTNPDINDPDGWSAPKDFYDGMPDLVRLAGGSLVSMWVICDPSNCHLFASDSHGRLLRSQTSRARFPQGMTQPVVAVDDSRQGTSLAASHVYRVTGTGKYLLLGQAFGGDGHAYLRSWTATRLAGPWTSQTGNPAHPFAGANNITFPAGPWTSDIVDGEIVRDGYDQHLSISPCRLQLLYLGLDRRFSDNRSFGLGLLTQTNSTCR
jgi:endo-1,4-beta-xylanase